MNSRLYSKEQEHQASTSLKCKTACLFIITNHRFRTGPLEAGRFMKNLFQPFSTMHRYRCRRPPGSATEVSPSSVISGGNDLWFLV